MPTISDVLGGVVESRRVLRSWSLDGRWRRLLFLGQFVGNNIAFRI
jgi:hypothetical protein